MRNGIFHTAHVVSLRPNSSFSNSTLITWASVNSNIETVLSLIVKKQ